MTTSSDSKPSFNPPAEAEWHRMIAEAAYYLAEKRGFHGDALDDWFAAEQHVRQIISPPSEPEAPMNTATTQNPRNSKPASATQSSNSTRNSPDTTQHDGTSNFEKFAATQAAGDGIQGDTLKPHKTEAEKIGANMADRK